MEITDECLKDFWIWYLLPEQRKEYKTSSMIGNNASIRIRFLAMSFTERYGVFIDFFDALTDREDIACRLCIILSETQKGFTYAVNGSISKTFEGRKKTRREAIRHADRMYDGWKSSQNI